MDINVILPAIGSGLCAALGTYIIRLESRLGLSRWGGLVLLFGAVWGAGQALEFSKPGFGGLKVMALGWFGALFLVPSFLILTLKLRRTERLRERGWVLFFLPFIFLYLALLSNNWHHLFYEQIALPTKPEMLGPLAWAAAILIISVMTIVLVLLGRNAVEIKSKRGKRQTTLILIAAAIPWASNFSFLIFPFNESSTFIVTGPLIAYAIWRYRLPLALPPVSRIFIAVPEGYKPKPEFALKEGESRLVLEEKPVESAEIFRDFVTHDVPGLWVTSLPPGEIERKYDFIRTPVISLTSKGEMGRLTIPPNEPDHLAHDISGYVERARKRCIILIDCFRELADVNGFKETLGFLQKLRNKLRDTKSNLLISVEPDAFTDEQIEEVEDAITK